MNSLKKKGSVVHIDKWQSGNSKFKNLYFYNEVLLNNVVTFLFSTLVQSTQTTE